MMTASRVAAFAIAFLAVADPAVTSSRSSRPLVSIVGDSTRLVDRVERVLDRQFTPVRGAMPASAATVMVGDALPDETGNLSGPIMAVTHARSGPVVRIASLEAPAIAPMNAHVPVNANIAVTGYRGPATIELRAGDMLVEHRDTDVDADTAWFEAAFHFVPTTRGPTLLRLFARLGESIADSATTVVEARDDRAQVLFFDPRASWLSTFVRRVVEQDPRFTVTHRVLTSRGLSNSTGSAPTSLRDAQLLTSYSTIVVGSPEQLSEADVAGLETFMRRRGGRVVLLKDRHSASPIDRLSGATTWRAVHLPQVTDLRSEFGNSPMRAQEIAWPAALPASATSHAVSIARDSTRRAVVWSIPVGAGRLVVSGALDAWHYRDATSGFDSFWPAIIAEFSAAAPAPIELSLSKRSLAPGQESRVNVWVREIAL